tara:strand:+ start:2623 stop:5157 length:2535 start_codon:yes stop_codon:yes gene_type:complete
MVAESSRNPKSKQSQGLTEKQITVFNSWKRPLQQALTLEAENGFENLEGRRQLFNNFIVSQLNLTPEFIDATTLKRIALFLDAFDVYPSSSESIRRRHVIDLRQLLQALSAKYNYQTEFNKPQLNLNNDSYGNIQRQKLKASLSLLSPIEEVPGLGQKLAEKLSSLGIIYVRDFFLHYPRDYIDYSCLRRITDLNEGDTVTVVANVRRCSSFTSPRNSNLSILDLQLQDFTGRIKATRFFVGRRFSNRSYLKQQERLYPLGAKVAVSGLVKVSPHGKSIHNPIIEVLDNDNAQLKSTSIGQLVPVYSLTEGITSERFRNFISIVLPLATSWFDPIPEKLLRNLSMPSKGRALINLHSPSNHETLKLSRRRLVFEEFFAFQLRLLLRRNIHRKLLSPGFEINSKTSSLSEKYIASLPFPLTNAQKRVLEEIDSDLMKNIPMCRLLQGDVGSGKTVVAIISLLKAVESGWQGAFMAPTEVLAEQHYKTLCQCLLQLHVTVELLTGSTNTTRRRDIINNLSNGSLKILVGTHALIEDPVSFLNLGLVVVDEQHRFGVRQRNLLLDKGLQPNLLTMTATPIPRTLALSLHGDLDVSQLDELPPGRTPVITRLFSRSQVNKVYQLIRDEISKGQQAYIVLPLIDDSEKLELRSAIQAHKELSSAVFPDLQLGLLHGKMSSKEKQNVIRNFVDNHFNILVSTTVVEVGVDIPNATVMVIENADRFGLSQLHQLRGRVGRGSLKSHCILLYDGNQQSSKQRLEFLVATNDGFEISEIDLKLRGPGQVLGTRQSGLPDFALASLIDDAEVLELAREQAIDILKMDPELKNHVELKLWVDQRGDCINSTPQLN